MKSLLLADSRRHCLLAALLSCTLSMGASADDLDVYNAYIETQKKPNILFVLDYSLSMQRPATRGGTGASRISVLKSAMNQLVDDNFDTINAGLGSFFQAGSTGIRWPISELSADAHSVDPSIPAGQLTVADVIKKRVAERGLTFETTTVEALVEAAQYFRGDPVTHNDTPVTDLDGHRPPEWNVTNQSYEGKSLDVSIAAAYSPANAYSDDLSQTFYCNDYSGSGGPNFCEDKFASACTAMTIDDPATIGFERTNNLWGDYQRCQYSRVNKWETPRFNSPIGDVCEIQENAIVLISDGMPTTSDNGASLESLIGPESECEDLSSTIFAGRKQTKWIAAGNCGPEIVRDLATKPVNPYLPNSRVKTYTVGFNVGAMGAEYLRRLADEGDGDEGDGSFFLAEDPQQLSAALESIVTDIRSSSESFSELSVDVDKASFSHSDRVYYSLFSPSKRRAWKGNLKGYFVDSTGIVDINGIAAAEDNVIIPAAQSFWSSIPDGNLPESGGASEQMVLGNRTLYTFTGNTLPAGGVDFAARTDTSLDNTNNAITNQVLGLGNSAADTTKREAVLDWIQTAPMGAPLHTKSVSVNYADRQVVYVMTNQGFLHAVDATKPSAKGIGDSTGGEELFAFMPASLLDNLPDLHTNDFGDNHIYGLDGPLTRWHDDTDSDGIVDDGESVMLYFGMRRGGSEYYAMDVSDPEAPVLKWQINPLTTGFDRLAQSWSRMSMIRVSHNGNPKRVLAFAAGFDADAQDDVDSPVQSKGNAIYMVDEDGRLLWTLDDSAHADLDYSIASDLAIIDSDGDQLADRLYVGDMAGQLWRVDFDDIDDNPTVTKLADLSDDDHQPFFYPPSIALNGEPGERFLSVSIGSGNRTNPLLKPVQNNLYMIRDNDVKKGAPADTFTTVAVGNLFDATDNTLQSADPTIAQAAQVALDAARGWRIRLANGEKALSKVLTYEGKLFATTYTPDTSNVQNICEVESAGTLYSMDVNDATPLLASSTGSASDRTQTVNTRGIPGPPVPVLTGDTDNTQIFVGKEAVESFPRRLSSVYWHAR